MLKKLLFTDQTSSQRGFTLVEILVAIGIMSTISLALIKINETMNKTSKNMNQQLDSVQLMGRLESILRNSGSCFNTFGGSILAVGGVAATNIRDDASPPNTVVTVAPPDNKFGDLTLTSVTYSEVGTLGTTDITIQNPAAPGSTIVVRERTADIRIRLRKGTNTNQAIDHNQTVGTRDIVKTLSYNFYVTAAAPTTVVACNGKDGEYVAAACAAFDGTIEGGDCKNITVRNLTTGDVAAQFTEKVGINSENNTDPDVLLHLRGDDDFTNQVRLTLPAASNGAGTGQGNMLMWLSDATSTLSGGVGINVDPSNNTFPKFNNARGQAFIRFGNSGSITLQTKNAAGTDYPDSIIVSDGAVGIGGAAPAAASNLLRVWGNARIDDSLSVIGNATIGTGGTPTNTTVNGVLNVSGNTNLGTGAGDQTLCNNGNCVTSWQVRNEGGSCTKHGYSDNSPAGGLYCPAAKVMTGIVAYSLYPATRGVLMEITCCRLLVR